MSRVDLRQDPPYQDLLYLAANMRQRDREEVFATMFGNHPADFAAVMKSAGAFKWGAYIDGKIVGIVGATPLWPKVWSSWAVGTDDWPKAVLSLTRHAKRFMIPTLLKAGFIRAEAQSLATHTDAHAWMESLGARRENVLYNYGKNGEKFVSFVWTRKTAKHAMKATRGPRPSVSRTGNT